MKRIRLLTVLLCAALGLGLLSFAACKPEEPAAPTAVLTLSAGEGGTLAETQYDVEVGADLSAFVADIRPTPEDGLSFAGWYNGDALLGAETMPEGGLTLTAKYTAGYTVQLYLEGVDGGYGEAQTSSGTALYGAPFAYSPAQEHFELDESRENRLSTDRLGKGETFTAYLKREVYGIHFFANAPEGEEIGDNMLPASVRYGESYTLPDAEALEAPPYLRFAGWAREENGELVYQAGEEVSPEADLFLYAVWDEAYFDRFGGGDFLFFPQTEPDTAVLLRAGVEYTGKILSGSSAEETRFSFQEGEKEILKGKANGLTRTFVYYREAQENAKYLHGDAYSYGPHEDGATIEFDGYGAVTYTVGETVQKGDVTYDPETMCYTFRSGEVGFRFMLTEMTVSGEPKAVFVTIGAEAGVYEYLYFYYQDEEIKEFGELYPILNGMGYVEIYDGNADLVYVGIYHPEEGGKIDLSLTDEEGESVEFVAKLLDYQGSKIMLIQDGREGTYTSEKDGTLVLDGFSGTNESAVWTDAEGTERKGMYAFDLTSLGGMLLRFREESGAITTFRIQNDRFTKVGDGSYAEYFIYYGSTGSSALGYSVLLFGEKGTATLWIEGETEVEGKVTEVAGDLYLFTSTDGTEVFQYKLGAGFFLIDEYEYYCHFFLYYPVFEEDDQDILRLPVEGGGTIMTDPESNVGVYTKDNVSAVGYLSVLDERYGMEGHVFWEFSDIATGVLYFFEVVGQDGSEHLVMLGDGTGYYELYGGDGEQSAYLLLLFGTDNVAVYFDDGNLSFGTFTYDGQTFRGVFTGEVGGESVTWRFVTMQANDGGWYYMLHNGLWDTDEKTFRGDGHTLVLDGYLFADYDGKEMNYYVVGPLEKQNCYRIYAYAVETDGVSEIFFDIDLANGTFTLCGYEAGQYNADDDSGDVLVLDGYGNVTRYNIHSHGDDGITLTPLERGQYRFVDTEEEILSLTFDKKSYRIHIWALYDGEEYTNYYTVEFAGAGTYVSGDWEYLSLDAYGEALFTDRYGISYEGEYTRLSENAVSFVSDALDGMQIFVLGEDSFTHPTSGMVVDGDVLVKYLGGEDKAIVIPDGVKKIAPLAFSVHEYGSRYRGADIASVDFADTVEVGANAFNGCTALVRVSGKKLKTLGANAFYACIELSTLDLPALEEIGEGAFRLCESLESVSLSAVKTVYSSAFSSCSALTKAELPAAVELYEGVFYDCFALETVVLGEHLTLLGTPDEVVAGVFGRSYGTSQQPLTVCLQGSSVPTVGHALFEGVDTYTVLVPDIDAVKQFYLDEGWAEYNANLGTQSEYDGTYYRYQYGVTAFVLNGLLREVNYDVTVMGAYYVESNVFHLVTFDPSAETKYKDEAKGVFTDGGVFLYDRSGFGIEEEYYEYFHRYFKAGEELTLHVNSTESDTIVFTPEEYTSLAVGGVYTVPAVWTKDGEKKNATVSLEFDQYYYASLYMVADGDRYGMTPNVSEESATVTLESPVFNPVVSLYSAADDSYLALSQNDRDGTNYTVSFVLTGITDESGTPFSLAQVPVEKGEGGKTFTAKQSYVFAGYSYELTFQITGEESFSYTYERERQIVVKAEDGSAQVVLYQNAEGEITSVTLSVGGREIGNDFANKVYTQTGNVYHWLVYEYNYAGDFTLTLTGEGENLTGTLTCGTVVKGYLDSVYVIAFYTGDVRTALYMCGMDGEYGKVEDDNVTAEGDHLTVTFKGNKYYVTIDPAEGATIVFADMTYQSNSWDDLQGSVRVERNPDGSITKMTLTVESKTYTDYTEYREEYSVYYIFTAGDTYYYVTLSTSSCSIYVPEQAEFRCGDFDVTLLLRDDNTVAAVISATYKGSPVEKVEFSSIYRSGTDYAKLSFTADGQTKNYLANITKKTMDELVERTLTTQDEKYRVTVLIAGDFVYEATKFEIKTDAEFEEVTIDWQYAESGEAYNYVLQDENYVSYYFNISKQGSDWTLTYVEQ